MRNGLLTFGRILCLEQTIIHCRVLTTSTDLFRGRVAGVALALDGLEELTSTKKDERSRKIRAVYGGKESSI